MKSISMMKATAYGMNFKVIIISLALNSPMKNKLKSVCGVNDIWSISKTTAKAFIPLCY